MTVQIFIPDIPEFLPLLKAAQTLDGSTVRAPQNGYWILEADRAVRFSRKELNLGPAIWNSALSGGFVGRIIDYGRDEMVIESEV